MPCWLAINRSLKLKGKFFNRSLKHQSFIEKQRNFFGSNFGRIEFRSDREGILHGEGPLLYGGALVEILESGEFGPAVIALASRLGLVS